MFGSIIAPFHLEDEACKKSEVNLRHGDEELPRNGSEIAVSTLLRPVIVRVLCVMGYDEL